MQGYRLYFLNSHNHIRHALEIECEDDARAIAWAETVSEGRPMELWQGARVVAKFDAERREA